jgi:lsr operon transcriptional repressor
MTTHSPPTDVGRWASEELLVRVSWFYYKDELTQDEIARRLGLSRASVGRMLERARKIGLVTINLNADCFDAFELSSALRQTFGLREALVVPDYDREPSDRAVLNARVGLGGAQFISTHLRPGATLGVGWGDTVARVIGATNFGPVGPVHLVTLTGGVDGYLQTIISSKGEMSTDTKTTTATVIPSPIVASTPALAAALKAEPTIQALLERARRVEHAIVGVGTPATDATLVRLGYLTATEATRLRERGVVGDILGQFFDSRGKILRLPIHSRRIGIELGDLKTIPNVIGVAGGLHKTEAILGALRGGYLDVLVTNEQVAHQLLALEAGTGRGRTPRP